MAIGGNVLAVARVSVGAGGPDGGFGWLCDAAYSGVEKLLVLVLALSAVRFWVRPRTEKREPIFPSLPTLVRIGGAIGWVGGLTGTGVGFF